MNHAADILLAVTAAVWWAAVLWYASRFPRLHLTAHSWNLILTGLLIACVVTEELVMQRWMGGWEHHSTAIAVFVIWGGALGFERLVFLWLTREHRRRLRPDTFAPQDQHTT